MKYQKLKKEAFHSMCRQCINEQYGLQLKTRAAITCLIRNCAAAAEISKTLWPILAAIAGGDCSLPGKKEP